MGDNSQGDEKRTRDWEKRENQDCELIELVNQKLQNVNRDPRLMQGSTVH